MTAPEAGTRDVLTAAPQGLQGSLGVRDLVLTVLAYNAPLAVAGALVPLVVGAGNGVGGPLTFALVGLMLGVLAVGLTTMSRYMKSPGAFYSYISAGMGRSFGLGGAFVAFVGYMAIVVPSFAYAGLVTSTWVRDVFGGPEIHWVAFSFLLWAMTSTVSLRRIDFSARILGLAMIAEIVVVLVWDLVVLIDGGPAGIATEAFRPSSITAAGSAPLALLFAVLCVTGFEAVAVFREETRDPVRTVPRATYIAVGFLACFYAVASLTFLTSYGADEAVARGGVDPLGSFLGSIQHYLGTAAVDIVHVLLITSSFAALLATQNIAARYLYTLGEDRVLPPRLGSVHPRYGSPFTAAAVVAVLCAGGFLYPALAGTDPVTFYARVLGFGGFCLQILMALTALSVFLFFRRHPEHPANAWQAIIAPALAFASLVVILVLAMKNMGLVIGGTQLQGWIVVGIAFGIFSGGTCWALFLRTSRPDVYERIGKQDI